MLSRYSKFIVAVLGAVAITIQAAVSDGEITSNEWVKIAFAAVTAAAVYLFPNAVTPKARARDERLASLD